MPIRVLALAAGLVLLAPLISEAAPRTCPLLSDARNDQTAAGDPAADLLRVDVASNARSATVVLGYAGEAHQAAPLRGHTYVVHLDTGEGAVQARADVAGSDRSFTLFRSGETTSTAAASGSAGTAIGPLRGRVDTARHEVHMVVPFALAADLLSRGTYVRVTAEVHASVLTPDLPVTGRAFVTEQSDVSQRAAGHQLGSPGCVPLES